MLMKQIQYILLLAIIAFSGIACEKKEEPKDSSKSKQRASQREKKSPQEVSKEAQTRSGEAKKDDSLKPAMPQQLQEAFDSIKKGKSKLVAFKKAWDASWDNSMSEKLICGDKVANGLLLSDEIKTFYDNTPESTFILLRSGENLEGFERSQVIIYSSTLAGIALDRDTAKNIPLILKKHANNIPPVKGDILLSKIALDTSKILEPVGSFSEGEFVDWKKLARAKNPTYRMIALRFFGRLCSEQDKEKQFFEGYLKETDPEIGMVFIDEVMRSPLEAKKELLRTFENTQREIGNVQVAESARDVIEQN